MLRIRANRKLDHRFIELRLGDTCIILADQQVEDLLQCLVELKAFMDEPQHYQEWEVN